MTILQLFLSFFHVGLFSIGGGMAAMPLIQEQVVSLRHWLTLTEFTDLITIAEMTPGPITINSATFVGIRIAGLPGALIATLGSILPGPLWFPRLPPPASPSSFWPSGGNRGSGPAWTQSTGSPWACSPQHFLCCANGSRAPSG